MDSEQKRQDTSNKEEDESVQEVQNSDFFVIGGGQPRLEVRPEVFDGEGARRACVKDVQHTEEDKAECKANRSHEDDERPSAWSDIACVEARNHEVCLVPVIATGACATVDSVSIHCDFNNFAVICWRNPFKVPSANCVSFHGVCEPTIHIVAQGLVDR